MSDVPCKYTLPAQGRSCRQFRDVVLRRRGDGKQWRDALWWRFTDFPGRPHACRRVRTIYSCDNRPPAPFLVQVLIYAARTTPVESMSPFTLPFWALGLDPWPQTKEDETNSEDLKGNTYA